MLRSLASLILRNWSRSPEWSIRWARGYLSQGRTVPVILRRRRPF